MAEIDFYYDFGSPNAYIAHAVLPGLAAEAGATLTYKPILLGGLFKLTDNKPPMVAFAGVQGKTAYMQQQIVRFLKRYSIPFAFNPHFPVMTTGLMRGALYAQGKPWAAKYIDEMFKAVWVDKLKMDDPAVIADRLGSCGLPAQEIMEATQTDTVKKGLFAATEEAQQRGAFGSPAMFVGKEQFFGKDSLDDLAWYLTTL